MGASLKKFFSKKKRLHFLVASILALCFFATGFVFAGNMDATYKWAWGENTGWINFNPTNGNVTVTDSALTGNIWSDNYGWIKLNPTNGGVLNDGEGVLSGHAWGTNVGWVNFSGVSIVSQEFTGTATGDITGDINFDCTNCSVKTQWTPNSLPVASSVSIDSEAESVVLTENTTKNVVCAGTVTDADGYADITSVTAKLYRSGVGAGAEDDNDVHYTLTGDANCVPSGGSGTTETYTCTFAVYYYADPTDAGQYEAQNWVCQMTPSDDKGAGTPDTDDIEMNSLSALDSSGVYNFGSLLPEATSTGEHTSTVTNTGNIAIDAEISGGAMTCNVLGSIPVGNQKYDTSYCEYGACSYTLSGTPTQRELDLPITESGNVPVTDLTYWQVSVPTGSEGYCSGSTTFSPVVD